MKGNVSKTKSVPGGEWGQNADYEKIKNKVTEISDKSTDKQYPTAKAVYNSTANKVDKIPGKGLSANDYTDEEKEKLKGLSNYDDTEIKNEIGGKVDKETGKGLSTNDYTTEEKTKLSELPSKAEIDKEFQDDREYLEYLNGELVSHGQNITITNGSVQELERGAEFTFNKVTTLDSNGTDTQYPSAKAVYDELVKKLNANEAVGKMVSMLEDQTGEIFNDYVNNKAMMDYSHAEGENNIAYGRSSHAEGSNNEARGVDSHCEGSGNKAYGNTSHCEGIGTTTINTGSHAEGQYTKAQGEGSHTEGISTKAIGKSSHAEGIGTTTSGEYQHVQGKYNKEDTANKYAHIVGNGTSDSDRSNAHTLDWDGNAWCQGDIRVGGTSYDDGKTVETKTAIVKSTETTASITLADNTEFIFTAELEELEISLPQNATEPYICSVVFNSGETPTGVVYATGSIYFKGINCTGLTFTPTANKHYTLMFVYDSMELICYVSAKPIYKIILFSTADTDEASVMSDESTAEETESVTEEPESVMEEPESEPNEVI